jgi:hypothetical protein
LSEPGVSFELERFEWVGNDRLELVGRWAGLRGHRFLRPTLDVEVGGERRRMLAVLEHKPWAPEEGEDWIAAFTWRGDPAKFDDAELTVSPELAVALPPAGGAAGAAKKGTGRDAASVDRRPARRPRTAVLEAELGSALAEAGDLREQLRAEQTNVRGLEAQLQQARDEIAAAERRASELEEVQRERDDAAAARNEAESARDAAREDAEEARTEADRARREAEQARRERDAARDRLAAAESEHAALTEARDRAREERNAWMQRARAAAADRGRADAATRAEEPPREEPPPAAPRAEDPPREEPPREDPPRAEPPREEPPPSPEPVREQPAPAAGEPEPEPPTAPIVSPGPQPPGERRTVRIGERAAPVRPAPDPLPHQPAWRPLLDTWGPRLVALIVLVVLAAIVLLLLSWAL